MPTTKSAASRYTTDALPWRPGPCRPTACTVTLTATHASLRKTRRTPPQPARLLTTSLSPYAPPSHLPRADAVGLSERRWIGSFDPRGADAGPPGPLLTTIKTPDGLYDLMIGLLGWRAIDCGLQSPAS
jgi:hypothetical protein